MATVYLAIDRRLDREVAVKVMHPHLAEAGSGRDFVARFRREALTVARLVHPGLVQVFDQGVDGDTSYLAMEYVDGTNLRHRLLERGALPLGEALTIIEQVLEALATAHRAGLVHRDIKPENVLIARDERIKIADFGLARTVTEMTASTSTVMGTVAYLAPELISTGVSDARTDVYAVGVLLYEMLAGKQPFSGNTPVHVAFQHVNSDIPAPSDVTPSLPAEVDDLVAALAARDPAERPDDAAAALAMIKRLRTDLDVSTPPRGGAAVPTYVDRTEPGADLVVEPGTELDDDTEQRFAARQQATEVVLHRGGATVALPIGLGLSPAPTSMASAGQAVAQRRPRLADRRNGDRRRLWIMIAVAVAVILAGGVAWWFALGPGARTTVPSLTGMDQAAATEALRDNHLEATFTEAFHRTVPAGQVISSDPAEGQQAPRGATVEVVLSKGPDWVPLPEGLIGMSQDEAVVALGAVGLVAADPSTEVHHDTAPAGTVLEATLADGSDAVVTGKAVRGDSITLTLSAGPAPVTVPNLVGSTVAAASRDLEADAVTVTSTGAWSDTVPAGQIMSQDPAAGATTHRGATITVVVSKGPQFVTMPNLRGRSYEDAAAELRRLGLVPKREDVGRNLLNIVREQSVRRGEQVQVGTEIVLRVV